MSTRKEVAELADVSPAVVSYVMNNSNYVSEEKRRAVLSAAAELNYQPNYIAKSLKSQKTYNLCLVCDDIRSELFAEIAYYSEQYASQYGYRLFLCSSQQDDSFLNSFMNHRIDGIFLGTSIYTAEQINQIAGSIPVVLYQAKQYPGLDPRVKCIQIEYDKAAYMLTERLIKKGFKRIAFFPPYRSGIRFLKDDDFRFNGYRAALSAYGYPYDEEYVCFDNSNYDAMLNKAEALCRSSAKRREKIAYVTGNDFLAIEIIKRLRKLGLYQPERIAITGMDYTASSEIVSPSLTTVGFSKDMIAKEAISFLVNEQANEHPETKNIPVFLVEGKSA